MDATVTKLKVIDGDGHVFEDIQDIVRRMPDDSKNNTTIKYFGPFPQLDNLHQGLWVSPPEAFVDPGGADGWVDFLDATQFEAAVLYPTMALSYGRTVDVELSIAGCRAYNDWLADTYVKRDSRFKGLALLPMRDIDEAVKELRRAVEELGMVGTMLPPTGLPQLLGQPCYWPVYEEADRLGCAVAVHGGAHQDMGLDQQGVFAAAHALGHPFALMLNFSDMLMQRVFERFTNCRFGFMEGGLAWFLLCMERCSGSYNAFRPADPRDRYLKVPQGQSVAQRILEYIEAGRLFVGVEGDEPAIAYAINTYGNKAFVFSSDYPHEVNKETIAHEIDELLEIDEISMEDKQAVLADNARRFYGI
ncbi:MAG: amidohydrolase family protein [Pseudomonadota bacterium]|nr:amidohydrolase family protein [Pseudomonadota bacterium]